MLHQPEYKLCSSYQAVPCHRPLEEQPLKEACEAARLFPPSTPSSCGTQRACSRFRRKGKSLKRCSQMESNTDTAPSHFCSCCSGPLRRSWSHVLVAPAMREWLRFLTKHLSATKTCTGCRNALKSLKKYAASLDRRKEFVSIFL